MSIARLGRLFASDQRNSTGGTFCLVVKVPSFPVNKVSGVKRAVCIELGSNGGDGGVSVSLPHSPGLGEATLDAPLGFIFPGLIRGWEDASILPHALSR